MKKTVLIVTILTLVVNLTACSTKSNEPIPETNGNIDVEESIETDTAEVIVETIMGDISLTLEALSAYNGKNGQPAYVAYNGVIYDVSHIAKWANGVHNGNIAGTDLSGKLEKAPHGVANLVLAKRVGIITE